MDAGTELQMLTILFTDVEGSTAFRTRAGDEAGNRVMATHERTVTEQVARHDGRLIKSLGDGCLAVFSSPRRAVECAIAVQREQRDAALRVRIGINTGEVALADGDVLGSPVNAAARIAAKAAGGEVLISDIVRQLLGSTDVSLRDRGRVRLKGFDERWRLHEVSWRQEWPAGSADEPVPLVGRSAELARVHRALDNLATGRGTVVLITGEPGIGKTRLAEEALTVARRRGRQVLAGHCPPFEGGLGLQPVVEAFGSLLADSTVADRAALADDLPQLARLFEGLALPAAPPVADPALERTLLFTAVTRLLERLATRAPTVLLIDDLQWADPASVELLHRLAQVTVDRPVALLLTQRPGEPDQGDRVRRLITALRRTRSFDQIELTRLDRTAVEQFVVAFLGGPPPPGLLDLLSPAAGTPLFVDALLRRLVEQGRLARAGAEWTLVPGGVEVPVAVRDLILERLDALPPDARRIAELIALTAAVADHDVLVAAADVDAGDLDDVLEALTASGVVVEQVEDGDLGYRLSHPLYYEVARDALSELARRRAHATLARAVEAVRPADVDALGRHYLAAGNALDRERALEVFAAAAQRAIERHGFVEARRYAQAALERARALDARDRLPLLLDLLGEAAQGAGHSDVAVEAWTEALALRDPALDPTGTAATRRALGLAEFDRGRAEEAVAHLQTAADLLMSVGASAPAGDVGFAEVTVLRRMGRLEELTFVADRLAAAAQVVDAPRIRAQAAYARAAAEMDAGRPRTALEHAVRGLAFLDGAGEDAVAYRLHTVCCDAASMLGDLTLMAAHTDAGWALGERLGIGAMSGGAALFRLWVDTLSGRWAQAWEGNNLYVEMAHRSGNDRLTAGALGVRVWLLAQRGDLEAADALVVDIKPRFAPLAAADRRGFGFLALAEANLRLQQNRPTEALAALEGFPDDVWISFAFGAPAVQARARLGDIPATERVVAVMRSMDTPYLDALAHRALGTVHLAIGDDAAAAAQLRAAADGFALLGMPYLEATSRLDLAAALRNADPAGAVVEAEAAAAACTTVGAEHDLRRAREVLAELGVMPDRSRRTPRRSGPLSARELEVALLVAEGLTNAEIAERLTLSVRTVTSHLDHIYGRLGLNGRAALARWVAVDEPVAGRT